MKSLNKEGFTLMELVIALIIVSIMSAGGLYVYSKYLGLSKVTTTLGQVSAVKAGVLNYMGQNNGSISDISIQSMVTQGILGESWTSSAALTKGEACPVGTSTIYHCDPWNGAITVESDTTYANVYTVDFGLVPENDAYKIANDLFNSLDNTDSGLGSGAVFSGTALTPNDAAAETSNTAGTLTLYFKV